MRGSGARHSWEPCEAVPLAQGTQVGERPHDESLEDDLDKVLQDHTRAEQEDVRGRGEKRQADLHRFWRQTWPRRASREVAMRLLDHAVEVG
eukprot:9288271-Alexandrium_andersonii.AAC.1